MSFTKGPRHRLGFKGSIAGWSYVGCAPAPSTLLICRSLRMTSAEKRKIVPGKVLAVASPGTCQLTVLIACGWRCTALHQTGALPSQTLPPAGAPCICMRSGTVNKQNGITAAGQTQHAVLLTVKHAGELPINTLGSRCVNRYAYRAGERSMCPLGVSTRRPLSLPFFQRWML